MLGHRDASRLLIVCAVLASTLTTFAAPWQAGSAELQLELTRAEKSAWPTTVGTVVLPAGPGLSAPDLRCQVIDGAGKTVSHRLLPAVPGDRRQLLFDTSGKQESYFVYTGANLPAPTSWEPPAGLIWVTRVPQKGAEHPATPADFLALWKAAAPQGCSLAGQIFSGIQPNGPSGNFLSVISGSLHVKNAGDYIFATSSQDASFLYVADQLVASAPGAHGINRLPNQDGSKALHLEQGIYPIRYLNAAIGGFTIVASWRRLGTPEEEKAMSPREQAWQVIPPEAFPPVARFQIREVAAKSGAATWFNWRDSGYCQDGATLLVDTALQAPKREGTVWQWQFDDGSTDSGDSVTHTWFHAGLREIRLTPVVNGKSGETLAIGCRTDLRWAQQENWDDQRYSEQLARLKKLDLTKLPLAEFNAFLTVSHDREDYDLIKLATPVLLARLAEKPDAATIVQHAILIQHYQMRQYAEAEKLFLHVCQEPADTRPGATARLHLGGLRIRGFMQLPEGLALLSEIPDPTKVSEDGKLREGILSNEEYSLREVFRADALLLEGKVEEARAKYQAEQRTEVVASPSYEVWRRTRIDLINDYQRRGELGAALDKIQELEFRSVIERLDPEVGILRVRLHMARNELGFALSHALRLMQNRAADRFQEELMYILVELYTKLGERDRAVSVLRRLLSTYPYSEYAAKARDRWVSQETRNNP